MIALLAAVLLGQTLPPPGETRYALVVGAHAGASGETTLAYAGRDARRVSDVLVELGGFLPDNVVTLVDPDAGRVRDAFARLNARLRAERGPGKTSVLLVYYSGHADQKALHLGDSVLPWDELVNSVQGSAAELRMLVVDACRSGFATRVKGLRPDEPFALPFQAEPAAEGTAILASATQGEDAQESDAIQASFFTHHLLAGLRGAADANDDTRVSLDEAFRYARDQTVASTATTASGIQHPTYRYDFKGRANVVLSALTTTGSQGRVVLPGEGRFLFHEGRADGPLAAEVASRAAGLRVMLPAGRYVVRWRRPDRYYEGPLMVLPGAEAKLETKSMQVFEYAKLVRKGGGVGPALELAAFGGIGTSMLVDYDATWSTGLVLGIDTEIVGLDLAFYYGRAASSEPLQDGLEDLTLAASDEQIGVVFGARKSFDAGPLTYGFGLRAGVVVHAQSYAEPAESGRTRAVPIIEVPVRFSWAVSGPWSILLEGGLAAAIVEVETGFGDSATEARLSGWGRLGLGYSFR